MADTGGAARGREAALEVRRGKRAKRRAKVAELYPGLSIPQITKALTGSELESSQASIANDVKELGISAPVGPRRKHSKPKPRQCLNRADPACPHHNVGGWFTPKDASQVARGDGQTCSPLCARRSLVGRDVGRRAAGERHRRADEELARLNAVGLQSTRQAAEELATAESTLYGRYADVLPVERRLVEGEQLRLVRSHDVKALARRRARSRRVAYYDDPASWFVHLDKLDISPARARLLLDARAKARKRHRRIRVGTGRPKSVGPPVYHFEWAERFWLLEAELRERYERFHVEGDPPPTKWEVALLVAAADYEDHPERWSYPPDDQRRAAADRVWTAVKALQNAQSQTPA